MTSWGFGLSAAACLQAIFGIGIVSYHNLTLAPSMNKTRLSSKGQVIIPKSLRDSRHWQVGQELEVIDTVDGVLLKPVRAVKPAALDELYGCLQYPGPARSLEDMQKAIAEGVTQQGIISDDQH